MPKNRENTYSFAIKFLFKIIKPYKNWYIAATLLIFTLAGVNLLLAKITQRLIDSVVNSDLNSTIYAGIIYFVFICINTMMFFISGRCVSRLSAGSGKHLKDMACHAILHADYRSFEKLKAGDILKTINEDTGTVCAFIEEDLVGLFSQLVMAITALIYLIILNPILALVTFAYTPIGMFTTIKINKKMTPLYQIEADKSGKALSVLEQFLSQIPVVKSFEMERRMRNKMYAMYESQYSTEKQITHWHSLIQTACSTTSCIPRICFILYAGYSVMNQKMTLGSFSAMIELINYTIGPSVYFPFLLNKFNYSIAAMQRIGKICGLPINTKNPIQSENKLGKVVIGKDDTPSLKINHISFRYSDEPVIRDFTYSHQGYGILAFCGESGCGKSTLLNLISGIYDPENGSVRVSHPYMFVDQDIYIFQMSLYENVRLSRPEATREEINEAMKAAGILELTETLAEGYDTMLGNGHRELSGGEKQRIGLARVLLSDVPIWIMDEPTSALDDQTEQTICDTIKRYADKKLIILTSHRPKLLRLADERIEVPMLNQMHILRREM